MTLPHAVFQDPRTIVYSRDVSREVGDRAAAPSSTAFSAGIRFCFCLGWGFSGLQLRHRILNASALAGIISFMLTRNCSTTFSSNVNAYSYVRV